MKKRLAMLLSVAMAFSMFANVAFGADATLTTTQKYEALVEAGIFNGIPGSTDPQLNVQTDRAQFAKILALTTGLEQVTGKTSFKDAGYATNWAKGYIEAVVEAGYMNGVGGEKFNLTGKITGEQMAKAFALALGLEEVKDAEAIEGVSPWAYGWVAAAKNAGFDYSMDGKWNTPVTRAVLVDAAYAVKEKVGVSVEKVQIIDEKNIEVTFSDKEVVKVALDKALVEGEKTTVAVSHKGKTYNVEVTLEALSATTKLVGAKKIEVTFNRAVDVNKATFEVKNSVGTKANVSKVTYNENSTVATVEFVTNLIKGDYTVSVTGASQNAVDAGKFSVEDEKITKIEFLSDKAVLDRNNPKVVTTSIKVYNQYEEDITKTKATGLSITTAKGTAVPATNGVVTITATADFVKDEKVALTALDVNSTTFASSVLTVSDKAAVSEITATGIYNSEKETLTAGEATPSDWMLVLEAKDQYGNIISDVATIKEDVHVSVTNNTVVDAVYTDIKTETIDGETKVVLPLKAPTNGVTAGTTSINLLSKFTGKLSSFEVTVKENILVDTLTFSSPAVAVVGEWIEVPFVAVDQFGNEIKNVSDLEVGSGKEILSLSVSNVETNGWKFEQDNVNNKVKFLVKPAAKGLVSITGVTAKNKTFNISFSAVEGAEGKVIYATKDFTSNYAKGASSTLELSNVKVQDQYGRDFEVGAAYDVYVKTSDAKKVSLAGTTQTFANDTSVYYSVKNKVTVKGEDAGSATLTFVLAKDGKVVEGSQFTKSSRVVTVADITKFEVADLNLAKNGDATRAAKVKVEGVLADGNKVVVPASYYNVETLDTALVYADSKITANFADAATTFKDGDIKKTVVVTVYGKDTAETVTKELTISNKASEVAKLELQDGTNVDKESDTVVSVDASIAQDFNAVVSQAVKATDQYGVKYSGDLKVLTSNIKKPDGKEGTAAEITSGYKYTLVVVAPNSKNITFQVVVK